MLQLYVFHLQTALQTLTTIISVKYTSTGTAGKDHTDCIGIQGVGGIYLLWLVAKLLNSIKPQFPSGLKESLLMKASCDISQREREV